jgi:cytochrome c553
MYRNLCVFVLAAATSIAATPAVSSARASQAISASQVQEGFRISPIPKGQLKFKSSNSDMVGLGSYIVNGVGDCTGCHTFPRFLEKGDTAGSNPAAGDPYEGIPSDQSGHSVLSANYNVQHYLGGGQCFGPFMARNIAPDPISGLPENLTQQEFIQALRTGADVTCAKNPADPICAIEPPVPVLQVMPWATYHNMTDRDLKAIYAYLSALPSTTPCNTVDDGCPGFSGAASKSTTYVYANSDDCPNPPPPQ